MPLFARILGTSVAILCSLLLAACATYHPPQIDKVPFLERAKARGDEKVWVTVAVLSARESEAVFGVPLASYGVQPVWVKIENEDDVPYWFLRISLDPDYFSPGETAYRSRFSFSKSANNRLEEYLRKKDIGSYVAPGGVISGFLFTNLDKGTKEVNIELLGW